MDDLISKQMAINALRTCQIYKFDSLDDRKIMLADAEDVIEALPSAQPTLYGFNLKNLIVFADAVNKKGISDFEIEDFVRNARDAWEYAWEEFQRTQKKALESIMRSDYYEG